MIAEISYNIDQQWKIINQIIQDYTVPPCKDKPDCMDSDKWNTCKLNLKPIFGCNGKDDPIESSYFQTKYLII